MPDPVLTIRNLSKTFPGQQALRNVSLEVQGGEIHALVGQNGSGKSTLIKCLTGYHSPDPGAEIIVGGNRLTHFSPEQAQRHGIAAVHQDLGLVPTLSILENFCLGKGFTTGPLWNIRWRLESDRVAKLLASFGHSHPPSTLVYQLPVTDRTIVAIVRAFQTMEERQGRLLILDEPTAGLPEAEMERCFAAIRLAASKGAGVIYVSHRLSEIFQLANRATVLRDGIRVGTFDMADLNEGKLVELIVGRAVESLCPLTSASSKGHFVMETEALSGRIVKGASFKIRSGEIVGIAGLSGCGGSELGRLLSGAQQPVAGAIRLKGKEVSFRHPSEAIRGGIGYITDDRKRDGSFPKMSVGDNITITDLRRFFKNWRLQRRSEYKEIRELVSTFEVNPGVPERPFNTLSGGNQQKAILAKWMRLKPDLLICDEPVKGVDVGSKREVYRHIAASGSAVLLISSEFADLSHICDRVMMMRNGIICGELCGAEISEERIVQTCCK